jgi:hypothetical protein
VDFPADPGARLPLERVKPGLVLSLGVVDVSVPAAEAVEDLLARVDPVVDERGEDDVAIATNGGRAGVSRESLTALAENRNRGSPAATRTPSTGSAPRSWATTSSRTPPSPWRSANSASRGWST